jgi:hypothetical protein
MTQPIPIHLAVEDELSEAVLRKILSQSNRPFAVGTCFNRGGFGYIRKMIRGFNNAAKGTPFLILTDLDSIPCAPELMSTWLKEPVHPNLMFRVAVREVETWLLADGAGFAKFLGIRRTLAPADVDAIDDPKACLIRLARKSPRRELRWDIAPPPGSTRKIGPNYNGRLISFVRDRWNLSAATLSSPSLQRTVKAVARFVPVLEQQTT